MKSTGFIKIFLIIGLLFVNRMNAQVQTGLTVISNQVGAPASMKQAELKSIFMGEKQRWRNGKKILIALMKTNTPAGKNVCEKVYDMSGEEVQKFWLALVFQGKAVAPLFFSSVSELQNFVTDNPGAIGIIDQVPSSSGAVVVTIDGKKTF